MAKYLHLFETENAFSAVYDGEDYLEPWVSLTMETSAVNYNKAEEPVGEIWLDLSTGGYVQPTGRGDINLQTSDVPETWPHETVLVKEPNGIVRQYTCTDYDYDFVDYSRAATQEERDNYDIVELEIEVWTDGSGNYGIWRPVMEK